MVRVCTICQYETNIDQGYCQHMLKFHKSQANFKVVCALCNRIYNKENSFRRHLKRKHKEIIRNENEDQDDQDPDVDDGEQENEHFLGPKWQSAKYVLSLKAKHNVSDTAIEEIMGTTEDFVTNILNIVQGGVQEKIQENIMMPIEIDCKEIFNPGGMFSGLNSAGQRQRYFQNNFGFLVSATCPV